MGAIHSRVSHEAKRLRQVTGATNNVLVVPYVEVIPVNGYTESVGLANTIMDIEIRNVGGAPSGGAVSVLIESHTNQAFPTTPRTLATVAFASIPDDTSVMVEDVADGKSYIRVSNTSDVEIEVRYWRKPDRI